MVGKKFGFGMDQLETWQLLLDIFKCILTCTCLLIQYFLNPFLLSSYWTLSLPLYNKNDDTIFLKGTLKLPDRAFTRCSVLFDLVRLKALIRMTLHRGDSIHLTEMDNPRFIDNI